MGKRNVEGRMGNSREKTLKGELTKSNMKKSYGNRLTTELISNSNNQN